MTVRVLWVSLIVLGLSAGVADAAEFFNSAEPGCQTNAQGQPANPNYLMCDDFEDGTYVVSDTFNDPANDGWNFVTTPGNKTGATCGGAGAGGTQCTSTHVLVNGSDGGGGAGRPATHALYNTPNDSLNALRVRHYIKFMPGYVFNGNQKFSSGQQNAHNGGIAYYGIGANLAEMWLCPVQSCNNMNEGYLKQNQGNNISMTPGNWYYMEYRVVLNTINVRNGIWQLWINDCGASGICTGSPTLRASYSNVLYLGTGFQGIVNGLIGGYYLDIWGNPSDGGDLRVDQIVIARDANGLIGFMGAASNPPPANPAPGPPTNPVMR